MANKVVKVIPARPQGIIIDQAGVIKRKRVAAYARVSTEKDEQTNSYEAQVNYYTNYIQANPEWVFVGIYSDAGITGTSTKKREGFKRMIDDAMNGKIDLILTKSVSRFARNTVDSLVNVRKLREKGVEVYFEKENIYTLDTKGELLLTILSSLAESESVSISQNTTWGQRKRFADGKVSFAYSNFLGYDMGQDGKLHINEEQAKVVKRIYEEYLLGYTPSYIAKRLTVDNIPTPQRKKVWYQGVIDSILTNEKYIGDSILQKTFSTDVLTKKRKKNEGELPQYYIENNHPAIITDEIFEMVKEEMARRKSAGLMTNVSCFSGRILCGDCGGYFGRKVWHSNQPNRTIVWQCNKKFSNPDACGTTSIKEKAIEEAFVRAFNEMFSRKDEIIENYKLCIDVICDDSKFQERKNELDKALEEKTIVIKDFLLKCSKTEENIEESNARYDVLIKEFEALNAERQKCLDMISSLAAKRVKINSFLNILNSTEGVINSFNEVLFQKSVNHMVINHDLTIDVIWRDESKTTTYIERGVKEVKKSAPRIKPEKVLSDHTCLCCGKQLYITPGKVQRIFCNKKCGETYRRAKAKEARLENNTISHA